MKVSETTRWYDYTGDTIWFVLRRTLYLVYTIKQLSSKHRATRAHIAHVYFEYICWMFARWLLNVCLIV